MFKVPHIKVFIISIVLMGISTVYAQKKTFVGLNLAPLLVNTYDIRLEHQLSPHFAIQGAIGFRKQQRSAGENPRIVPLKDYIQFENQAISFSFGGRIFNRSALKYPYIALDITGVYYDELIEPRIINGGQNVLSVENFKIGSTVTIGMVSRLFSRVELDMGLQFGYAGPRDELLAYYFPGMGYTTFGFGRYGVEGGHLQPIVTIRYDLIKDKRSRIRQME